MHKTKTVILTDIISPYRIRPFNCLAEDSGIDLLVMFLAETEARRRWRIRREEIRFKFEVLPGWEFRKSDRDGSLLLNPSVFWRLRRARPEVLVCGGWYHPSMWLSALYSTMSNTRFILWSESTLFDRRSWSRIRELGKGWLVSKADGFIAPGKRQAQYLRYIGAPLERVWTAPNAVDSDLFSREAEQYRDQRFRIRRALGAKGLIFLYVGRLVEGKGIFDLLSAFDLATKALPAREASLILVGDGPDKLRFEEVSARRNIQNVFVEGFRDQDELPKYYAIADIFVFPTHTDPWGLVLNEAMACGLPIICSMAAGAADDLVEQGKNGFLFPPGDIEGLTRLMMACMSYPALLESMGSRSQEIIQSYTPEHMARGFAAAIHSFD